ncbi:MAG TPA: hypothetical protein VLW53_08505 [Candidatus Eisenbacteria bacterium]|nr:hypothetical protein [Candidatus Eisenbacteria bacterium]
MAAIEVDPATLHDIARRLRTAAADTAGVRRAAAVTTDAITGSAALTAALRHHTEAWDYSLRRLRQHIAEVARAVDEAARTYHDTEQALSGPAAPGRKWSSSRSMPP